MATAPEWLQKLANEWIKRLRIHHNVRLEVGPAPNGDPENYGFCSVYSKLERADVYIHEKLKLDDPETVKTIIHELNHIAHARICYFLRNIIVQQLGNQAAEVSTQTYRDLFLEPYIEQQTSVLFELSYPDGWLESSDYKKLIS